MKAIFTILLFLFCPPAFCQYNFYFGNIHSHSSYSDGNRDSVATGFYTPGDDYNFAKATYNMDFLGVSDHNHFTSNNNPGMHVSDYARGLYQADTATNNGSFVALYGIEWGTISQGGHVIAFGLPGLIGWENGSGGWGSSNNYDIFCAKGDFTSFWSIVHTYPSAFVTLAHPQTGDFGNLLSTYASANAIADSVVTGVAVRSGSAFSTTTNYTDPPATSYESKYTTLLARGYHVGPVIDHDNHYTTFGRTNPSRTVVLAGSLNRDSIMAAYKNIRYYASDDWNTNVHYTINGHFMGSRFTSTSDPFISVTVNDPDVPGDPGDEINSIQVYYGITGSGINATVLTSNTGSSTLSYTHAASINTGYYYYVKIIQADGDIIWTAPIWVYRNTVVLPITLSLFHGNQVNDKIQLHWTTAQEINAGYFDIEHAADGNTFTKIGTMPSRFNNSSTETHYAFADLSPVKGLNFYRLKQFDLDGKSRYSNIIPVLFNRSITEAIKINPNPVTGTLNIALTVSENAVIMYTIYSGDGRKLRSLHASLHAGNNMISTDVSGLANGIYILVITSNNERIAETKFVKQ